jgi:hypothetical protein
MRGFLNKALPLHADFDAFCIDHFGDLLPRFGDGWDLVSKQNLLLTAVPAERLLAALEAAFASDGAVLRQLAEMRRHLSPDELQRQLHSVELARLCEARALRLATGGATQDLDPRIRELKQLLRRLPVLQECEILGERYKLLSLLGNGGFARVYQAYDLLSKALVAVKVLHSDKSDDPRSLGRFERGARQMAQLSHPHIVRVLGEPAEQDGFHYFRDGVRKRRRLGACGQGRGAESGRQAAGGAGGGVGPASCPRAPADPPRREAGEHPAR